jgi:DNA-binding MarR family transcriptional regulator
MTPALASLYRILCEKADAGEPCPTNVELAHAMGMDSSGSASGAMLRLEKLGHITVERGQNFRRVTITETGQSLATCGKFKPRVRIGRPHKSRSPEIDDSKLIRIDSRACFNCGNSGYAGCNCHRPVEILRGVAL